MPNDTTKDLMAFVPKVTFELIPIRDLVANQEYQRSLSESHILRTAQDFDLYQVNPVKVSRRDGINYVFNGQHTIEIIALVSGSRDTPVWCMVYDDMSYTSEAHVFADQQKYVKALAPFDIFMAHIQAQDQKYLLIRDLVESYHLEISNNKAQGSICAVSTLEHIYDKFGFQVLNRTLRLCVGTWEGEINSFSGNILSAIARLIVIFGEELNDEMFIDHVGRVTVKAITRTAKERRPGALGYAEAILIAYNTKCKTRLPMRRLYGSGSDEEIDDVEDDSGESASPAM